MLTLPTTLTQDGANDCLAELTARLPAEAAQVVVDAAALRAFDSSALAVLLALRRECARVGKHFAVRGLPERLRNLASVYGIEPLLPSA